MNGRLRWAGGVARAALLAGLLVGLGACGADLPYDRYAIVYGVADYQDGPGDLDYSDDDALAMQAMLAGQGYSVWLETDAAADRDHLLEDISEVAAQAGEGDLFLFYFAGHGGQAAPGPESDGADPYDEFIYLYGSDSASLSATYSDDGLADAFSPIAARRKLIILDTCNSGGFIGNELEAGGAENILERAARAIRLYANFDDRSPDIPPWEALVLSAAGEREESLEGEPYFHGVFTYYLLQAETEADRDADGWVTVTEAFDHARRCILRDGRVSGAFHPQVSGGPVDYVFLEAR